MKKTVVVSLIVGMLLVSFAAGALVKYLSNSVSADLSVSSPIEVTWTIEPEDVYGGGTLEFETTALNKANRDIEIYNQLTEIHAPSGEDWVGTELDAVRVGGVDIPLSCIYYAKPDGTLVPFSTIGTYNTNVARIYMDMTAAGGALNCDGVPHTYTHSAGGTATSNVQADLNVAFATSDYTIKVCYLMDLSGEC